jgi:hypothetical protein
MKIGPFGAEKTRQNEKKCFWPGSPAPGSPDAQGVIWGADRAADLRAKC